MAHVFGVDPSSPRTMAGTVVVSEAEVLESTVFTMDPGGSARIITLPDPTLASMAGQFVLIRNSADAAEVITVNDSVGLVGTPTQNESILCFCDGVRFRGMVGIGT